MNKDQHPPRWMTRFIHKLAPKQFAEEIIGDLDEIFISDARSKNSRRVKLNYVINGFGFLLKSFFWKKSTNTHKSKSIMITSYFKMARRSLLAYKSNTIINILGLTFGITAALVIFIVVNFENSFDAFHSNADRTYRLVRVSGKNMDEFRSGISFPLPGAMKDEISNLDHITAMEYQGGGYVDILNDSATSLKTFHEDRGIALVEQSYFEIFDYKDTPFKWLQGNAQTALTNPKSVVLTRSVAIKYFGNDAQALGKSLRFEKEIDCIVTGVIEDFPLNTDLPFTMLVSYNTVHQPGSQRMTDWYSVNDTHHTYIVLKEGTSQAEMETQIAKVHAAHTPKELHESRHYLLQKLSDLHHEARFQTYSGRTISKETVLALSLIAIFLIVTASINYVNLSTAQSITRSKEIGLRKVMGSNKSNLIWQFIIETFVIVLFAGILALGLTEFVLFQFQALLNMTWTGVHFNDPFVMIALLIIILSVTSLSGVYPSIMISRFDPVTTLKSKFSTQQFKGFSFRKALVVLQFTVIQILVLGTYIVVRQMKYFSNRDMGFNAESIVNSGIPDNNVSKLEVLSNQLRKEPFVSDVSFSFSLPSGVQRYRNYQDMSKTGSSLPEDRIVFEYASIDEHFLDLYHIRLLAGRSLVKNEPKENMLINQAMAKSLRLGEPTEAIGASLQMGDRKVTVVGVVEDYYSNSLKERVDAIAMTYDTADYYVMSIKLDTRMSADALTAAVAKIESHWKEIYPDFVFSYQFFDDNIAAFYAQEKKYATLFQLFSLVFLVIGCLGLYGLITFVVNRKGKEVAIRKVLGASVSQILVMFSQEYVQLIAISFLIAVPITWYSVNSWLSNFEERIPLSWWLFLIPGLLVLAICLFVVVVKSIRTANANPVDSLKYE